MTDLIPLIRAEMTEVSPGGIAGAIGRLARTGRIERGVRLPTVRALAADLAVSPTTIAEAWRTLRGAGLITTEGRRGTFLCRAADGLDRFWRIPVDRTGGVLDLSTGTPDPALLPSLDEALRKLTPAAAATSYFEPPVLADLEEEVRRRLPFQPARLTVVDGALDALDRIISQRVGIGDRVIVEDPTFAPIIDLLDLRGAEVIGIPVDERGIDPERLTAAMKLRPALVIVQPRAQNPTGSTWDERRVSDLAAALADSPALIIEDDHSADVSGAPLISLATRLPERTVHIRSFSKAYGPDLRLAAVGGPSGPIDDLAHRRQLGPAWSSRLLQALLLNLLTSRGVQAAIETAASTYDDRRTRLAAALGERGVQVASGHGFNIWMPVRSEQTALVMLAAAGIGAAPGSPFQVHQQAGHLRLTVSTVADGHEELAGRLADAVRAGPTTGIRA